MGVQFRFTRTRYQVMPEAFKDCPASTLETRSVYPGASIFSFATLRVCRHTESMYGSWIIFVNGFVLQ